MAAKGLLERIAYGLMDCTILGLPWFAFKAATIQMDMAFPDCHIITLGSPATATWALRAEELDRPLCAERRPETHNGSWSGGWRVRAGQIL